MKSIASPQTANPRGFLRLRDALRLAFVNLAGNRRRTSLYPLCPPRAHQQTTLTNVAKTYQAGN